MNVAPSVPLDIFKKLSSRQVRLHLINSRALGGDNPINQIADGNETRQFSILQYGQVPDAFVRHQPHAILDGVMRRGAGDIGGDDFADERLLGSLAGQGDLPGVIALREYADDLV